MRVLHIVDSDTDAGRVVLATTDGVEQFELSIDQELRSILTDAPITPSTPARTGDGEPKITPREIQMRVRAGETPQSLVEAFGGSLDWVMRFATPVLAERARIADEARRAKARRSTTEGQTVVFGDAVDERFAAHGIDPASVRWDAHRREDGQWVLAASWVGGQADRQAEWTFQLAGRTVAPLDDTAADLLSDRPIRPVTPEPDPAMTVPSLTLAPPLESPVEPATPDAHTGPLPRAEEVFDQAKFEEPHLPMHVPDAPPERPATVTDLGVGTRADESDEEKAARAAIPSWDDILLGVRRKRD
ncbi:MAG: septation protein SepH [Jatrophihabitantaceae bacterium]